MNNQWRKKEVEKWQEYHQNLVERVKEQRQLIKINDEKRSRKQMIHFRQ